MQQVMAYYDAVLMLTTRPVFQAERRLCGTNTGTASEGTRGEMRALKKLPTDQRRIDGNELHALMKREEEHQLLTLLASEGQRQQQGHGCVSL
ncbi:unnamed protein product [Vitrella brassicaformis CCMP3155]|uniref:Uncharacterized protein n=1 Tax=Vitrella brassicaformis (strain CCMP3155) TaxID=1169540 RepID=A0A0G4H878_VITBC|nr:unnamed protein product [Vitrella brassicaformis CCMP3155]|eukprot:CEM40112.1 unnamed protein product [Vitrella brassicaformis CCMP3155]